MSPAISSHPDFFIPSKQVLQKDSNISQADKALLMADWLAIEAHHHPSSGTPLFFYAAALAWYSNPPSTSDTLATVSSPAIGLIDAAAGEGQITFTSMPVSYHTLGSSTHIVGAQVLAPTFSAGTLTVTADLWGVNIVPTAGVQDSVHLTATAVPLTSGASTQVSGFTGPTPIGSTLVNDTHGARVVTPGGVMAFQLNLDFLCSGLTP